MIVIPYLAAGTVVAAFLALMVWPGPSPEDRPPGWPGPNFYDPGR